MSNKLSDIRRTFHNKFLRANFVTEIGRDKDNIEISENEERAKLKLVIINNLWSNKEITKIWRVNLEELNKASHDSISGKEDSTTEIALIILTQPSQKNYHQMNIYLIELKTSLNCKRIENIVRKLKSSMNRIYLLLTLNDHENSDKGYANQKIKVSFIAVFSRMRGNKILERLTVQDSNTPHSCDYRYKGIIFYNEDNVNENHQQSLGISQAEKDLIKILKKSTTESLLEVSTFLKERDKIEIKFFKNNYQDPNSYDTEDTIEFILEELIA